MTKGAKKIIEKMAELAAKSLPPEKYELWAQIQDYFDGVADDHQETGDTAKHNEKSGIEAVKAAIRALPRNIFLQTEQRDGVIEFWRRTQKGLGYAVKVGQMRGRVDKY